MSSVLYSKRSIPFIAPPLRSLPGRLNLLSGQNNLFFPTAKAAEDAAAAKDPTILFPPDSDDGLTGEESLATVQRMQLDCAALYDSKTVYVDSQAGGTFLDARCVGFGVVEDGCSPIILIAAAPYHRARTRLCDSTMSHRWRFLNLVMRNDLTGIYSLRRVNLLSRKNNLFYPTAKAAEDAAAAKDPAILFPPNDDDGKDYPYDGPTGEESLEKVQSLHVPPPSPSFQPISKRCGGSTWPDCTALSETKTVFVDSQSGDAFLHDAEARSVVAMSALFPPNREHWRWGRLLFPISGDDDTVYALDMEPGKAVKDEDKFKFHAMAHHRDRSWQLEELPRPLYADVVHPAAAYRKAQQIVSYGMAGAGEPWDLLLRHGEPGVEQGRRLGSAIRRQGRARSGARICIGFLKSPSRCLCASIDDDLFTDVDDSKWLPDVDSGDCCAMEPPWGWDRICPEPQVVSLGSGKFCITQFFETMGSERSGRGYDQTFAVFTGVEVVRRGRDDHENVEQEGNGSGGSTNITPPTELRLIVHKSKRYMLTQGTIEFERVHRRSLALLFAAADKDHVILDKDGNNNGRKKKKNGTKQIVGLPEALKHHHSHDTWVAMAGAGVICVSTPGKVEHDREGARGMAWLRPDVASPLVHVRDDDWRQLVPPWGWHEDNVVGLGSGKFCVFETLTEACSAWRWFAVAAAVSTNNDVQACNVNGKITAGTTEDLRVIIHKSKRYRLTKGNTIEFLSAIAGLVVANIPATAKHLDAIEHGEALALATGFSHRLEELGDAELAGAEGDDLWLGHMFVVPSPRRRRILPAVAMVHVQHSFDVLSHHSFDVLSHEAKLDPELPNGSAQSPALLHTRLAVSKQYVPRPLVDTQITSEETTLLAPLPLLPSSSTYGGHGRSSSTCQRFRLRWTMAWEPESLALVSLDVPIHGVHGVVAPLVVTGDGEGADAPPWTTIRLGVDRGSLPCRCASAALYYRAEISPWAQSPRPPPPPSLSGYSSSCAALPRCLSRSGEMSHRRRLLNLVMGNKLTGVCSLHHIDLHAPKNSLFYPSTSAAAAAATDLPLSSMTLKKMKRIRPEEPPRLSFQSMPSDSHRRLDCAALSETKTVFLDFHSRGAFIYDDAARCVVTLPTLHDIKWSTTCLAVSGDPAGAGDEDVVDDDDKIFVIGTHMYPAGDKEDTFQFQALSHRRKEYSSYSHPAFAYMNPWRCDELPPPPYIHGEGYLKTSIESYGIVGGGLLCISTEGVGTYCFDMASRVGYFFVTSDFPAVIVRQREQTLGLGPGPTVLFKQEATHWKAWKHELHPQANPVGVPKSLKERLRYKPDVALNTESYTASPAFTAGDWALPFSGKIEHVPELGVLVGFPAGEEDDDQRLGVSPLPWTVSAAVDGRRPKLLEVAGDLLPPEEWKKLVNLGSSKLCAVQFFQKMVYRCWRCEHAEVDRRLCAGVVVIMRTTTSRRVAWGSV
ncbi:hypothetical protein HU200_054486 [Digitaria exilis]|uniref:Uncharacterized protein n=1 Tax=Digitaria exilis TaxID=1010633 RepID=A0A835E463_9POAL|nr:hypothetical protein HU200_054486 [Digitaria exilis]